MWVAGVISLIVIGANNGANGGFALREAAESLPRDTAFNAIAWTSSNQLRASVINAVKATPVAAFIGAPEMLSALNDIASFTGERLTTYSFVAVYYLVLVQIVIVLSAQFVKWGKEKK
jgi:ABC-type arginine/histidine transport system permease subunit